MIPAHHPSRRSTRDRAWYTAARAAGRGALATLVLAAAVAAFPASLRAQSPSPPDSSEAARQVDVGGQWFRASCQECHATSLGDADFRLKWNGRTAWDLFEQIRSTMPEQEPGSLTLPTYASIVAYLMRLNGMPSGTGLVPADREGLSVITLSFPAAASRSVPAPARPLHR